MSDAVTMVPRGWNSGPTIPVGPPLGPVGTPNPMGISTKGDLYTYMHTSNLFADFEIFGSNIVPPYSELFR